MQGLRTHESDKFNRFFALIQAAAKKQDSVFFADAGDGNDFETAEFEGENMMGWLIPSEKANEFESLWENSAVDDTWSDFYLWAVWSLDGSNIKIQFEE